MAYSLGVVLLPYLFLGATVAADGGHGIQTNQMDLLSGSAALAVILAGIVQIWPSPAQMCRPGLNAFLDWLKSSVENDFYISIHSCDKKCQTQVFEPTLDSIGKRICINVGDAEDIGCVNSGYISVDELINIIQADGNGITLRELAMTARYPRMSQLSRIITVLRFSPTVGKRVIVFQLLSVGIMYILSWPFGGWLFSAIKSFLRGLWNVVRRVFGYLPIDNSRYRCYGLDYHMSELAEHRLGFEHLPWVRYSVYYLLLKLAGRQLSIRAWGIEDKKTIYEGNGDDPDDGDENEDSPAFEHPMVDQRRLAAIIATDRCSTATLLFAISLHSLRVVMLCKSIGFLPAHVITGSFSSVCLELEHTIIAFMCPRLETVYKTMYTYQGYTKKNTEISREIRDYLHLSYSLLLKKLQSPLGDLITGQQQMNILINLALRDVDTGYVDSVRLKKPREPSGAQPNVEGVIIGDQLLEKLYRGHMNALLSIHTLLDRFLVSNLYWGVSVWFLRTLLVVCMDLRLIEPNPSVTGRVQRAGRSGRTSEILEMLYLLVNLPFSMHIYDQVRKDNAADTWVEPKVPKNPSRNVTRRLNENRAVEKRGDLLRSIKNIVTFDYDECFSAPAWCVCRGHCRGICTLIVNELDMYLSIRNYFSIPYAFRMATVKENPLDASGPVSINLISGQRAQTQSSPGQPPISTPPVVMQPSPIHPTPEQPNSDNSVSSQPESTQPAPIHPTPEQPNSDNSVSSQSESTPPAPLQPGLARAEPTQSDTNIPASLQPAPVNATSTQLVTFDSDHYPDGPNCDKVVNVAPKLLFRPVNKIKTYAGTSQPNDPTTSVEKVFRLVCLSNRHQLLRLVKDGKVTWKRKTPEPTVTPNKKAVPRSKKPGFSISRWWQSINIRHRFRRVNLRIDNTYYLLSSCLYKNTPQLVIVLGDQIYTAQPPTDHSANSEAHSSAATPRELWPFKNFDTGLICNLQQDPYEVIRRVLPLRLPSVDMFTQQIAKEVAMFRWRLRRGRRRRRKDRYTLVSPSSNVRVKIDAIIPQ